MNILIDFMENRGLISTEQIERFFRFADRRELRSLTDGLAEALLPSGDIEPPSGAPGVFNNLASSSFRGDYECRRPYCRLRKLPEFSRFAALYSERMYFPIQLDSDRAVNKVDLYGTALVLQAIRPLIESGIVVPFGHYVHLCANCWEERFGPVTESLAGNEYAKFTVTYLPKKKSRSNQRFEFNIEGPPEFLPGGAVIYTVQQLPSIIRKEIEAHGHRSFKLSTAVIRDSGFLKIFFRPASEDFVLQEILGKNTGCTYVSDFDLEVQMFRALDADKQELEASSDVLNQLAHEIPLFRDLDIGTIVRLRKEEGDAFIAYRGALNEALKSLSPEYGATRQHAKTIYKDLIYPRVHDLRSRERAAQRSLHRGIVTGYGVPAATLAVGAVLGSLPHQVGSVLSAIGGYNLLNTALQRWEARQTAMDAIRGDRFYFLLKMEKKHRELCGHQHDSEK